MTFVIGLLTFVLVLNCAVLILLVLIQLPKKEAGAGLAFGGAATDALFGAGSGNMLTKITKYAAVLFFSLAILLGLTQTHFGSRATVDFERELEQQRRQPAGQLLPPAETPAPAATGLLTTPLETAPAPVNPAPEQ